MHKLCVLVALTGALVMLSGCGSTWENAWKGTRSLYREYLNPPAVIDYDDKGDLSDARAALARRIYGVDTRIGELERYMENADRQPSSESVSAMFVRFPWLSGFAAVDASTGEVLGEAPAMPLKQLDYTPLLSASARGGAVRGLRGLVQDNPLGPEILLAVPVYRDKDLVGLVVSHFEMRALMPFSEDPDNLIILAPEGVLWSGRFNVESTPLQKIDWEKAVRSSSSGTVSGSGGKFVWVARFVGTTPLIFAAPADVPVVEEQMAEHPFTPVVNDSFISPVREENVELGVSSSILEAPALPEGAFGAVETPISE